MKNLFYLFLCLGLTILATSCGGDDGPEVTISSPGDGDTFTQADSLSLSFAATDDVDIASLSASTSFFTLTIDGLDGAADTNVPIVETIAVAGVPAGDYTIVVAATDNEGNASSESVDITVQ